MSGYLETIYFRDESDRNQYPQALCNHLVVKYKINQGTKLLDVGCGKGNHVVGFNRCGIDVIGLDQYTNQSMAMEVRECNFEKDKFPITYRSFDVVFSKSVLEHVSNTDHILGEMHRALKPCGRVILMVPDWDSNHRWFWDDYTHVKPWTRKSLQNAMRIHGFRNVRCEYFRQLPILWKYPWLKLICDITALLPPSLKWKDKKEEQHRKFLRFSMEKMLLATGLK